MEPIYTYSNYRKYLKDYFNESKSKNSHFSFRSFANRAGFKARDYILRVMNGDRNLSNSSIYMLSKAMRLNNKEAAYFECLVNFNQASSTQEREHYYSKLSEINKHSTFTKIRNDQFEYYSTWYHSAIRSLVPVIDFHDDFAGLGKLMDPQITEKQARDSVKLLVRLGMMEKLKNGKYAATNPVITTGDEVVSHAVTNFHKTQMDLAKRSLDEHDSEKRDISGLTMSVSEKGFQRIKSEIQDFRKKIMAIASEDSGEDRAYQLNSYFFPISKTRAAK